MWHLAQWHSAIFHCYFFSAAPQEKHRVSVCLLQLPLLFWPESNSTLDKWSLRMRTSSSIDWQKCGLMLRGILREKDRAMSKRGRRSTHQTKGIIGSKERQRPCATKHILISSNVLCLAHTALYQLRPGWLSCPAYIITNDDWQPEKVLIFKWVTSFSFGVNLLSTSCVSVWRLLGFVLCMCGWMCVIEWGLVLIHKCFSQTKPISTFISLLPTSRR